MLGTGILFGLIFKFVVFTLVLGVLVTVHELGHFLVAKFFNVGVFEFAVGFGRKLVSYRWGETEYSIRMIPLGGFVRMVGDDPREVVEIREEAGEAETPKERGSMEFDSEEFDTEEFDTEEFDSEYARLQASMRADKSRWFLRQGFWPKFLIVLAGPVFNLVLAFVLAWIGYVVFGVYEIVDKPIIGSLSKGYPAEKAGLMVGDVILKVGDYQPTSWKDMADSITSQAGDGVVLQVQRDSQQLVFELNGKLDNAESAEMLGNERRFRIGIGPKLEARSVALWDTFYYSGADVTMWSYLTLKGIVKMVVGDVSPRNIRGPIFIFEQAGDVASQGVAPLLRFMLILSVSLAVLNLLPVPVLDGGHLMLFTIEAIMGEPLSLEAQERASQVGIFLLLCLMVFALGNDLLSMVE